MAVGLPKGPNYSRHSPPIVVEILFVWKHYEKDIFMLNKECFCLRTFKATVKTENETTSKLDHTQLQNISFSHTKIETHQCINQAVESYRITMTETCLIIASSERLHNIISQRICNRKLIKHITSRSSFNYANFLVSNCLMKSISCAFINSDSMLVFTSYIFCG